MSAEIIEVQSVGTQQGSSHVDFDMASTFAMNGSTDHWVSYLQTNSSCTLPEYTGLPLNSTRLSSNLFASQQDFSQSGPNHHNAHGRLVLDGVFTDLDMQPSMNTFLAGSNADIYPTSATFTASNAHHGSHNTATISPLNTQLRVEQASPSPDTKSSISSQRSTIALSDYSPFTNNADSRSSKHRCDGLHSNTKSYFSQARAGQRRGSEYVEPGSARAIYLEKNRKAASKCRSKQKRQQDELVETARDVKQRNKILKAEIEILESEMRNLLEVVSRHTECPDARLKQYLQRKAGHSSSSPAYKDNTLSPDKD